MFILKKASLDSDAFLFLKRESRMSDRLKDKIVVGKVRDSHGLKGELFVMTNLDKAPAWVSELKEFTLVFKAPNEEGKHEETVEKFSVKKVRPHKKGFIVKSDAIEDRNASDSYKGAIVYIDKTYLETEKGDEIYLQEVKGFAVYDGAKELGPIIGFSSNNVQDLLVVEYKDKKIEIPFVKAFVEKIDWDAKKVFLNLPEGLY
jgi:16S rRNA processing protein RimM